MTTHKPVPLRDYVDQRFIDHSEHHATLARQVERTDGEARELGKEVARISRVVYLGTGMAIIAAFAVPLALKQWGG